MIGVLFALAVTACILTLVWFGISYAIDKGHKALSQQKEFAKFVKPKRDVEANVDWAKLVESANKPKVKRKKSGGLPPGAKKLDV